jgi:hypothetical protein
MSAHRITTLYLVTVLGMPVLLGATACGEGEQERKRELLTPRDNERKRAQAREKRRIFDDKGELLDSGEKVGGVILPKGLTLYRRIDHHFFYRTTDITFEKLDRYFGAQLIATTVDRKDGTVEFGGAVPRTEMNAPRLDLHVTRLSGGPSSSEVYFRLSAKFKVVPPPDESGHQLGLSRQYRD